MLTVILANLLIRVDFETVEFLKIRTFQLNEDGVSESSSAVNLTDAHLNNLNT